MTVKVNKAIIKVHLLNLAFFLMVAPIKKRTVMTYVISLVISISGIPGPDSRNATPLSEPTMRSGNWPKVITK